MSKVKITTRGVLVLAVVFGWVACASIPAPAVTYSFKTPLVAGALGSRPVIDSRIAFAKVFCKALKTSGNADCGAFIELDGPPPPEEPFPPLVDSYKVIVVAGIFSACLPPSITIYKQGIEALKRDGLKYVDEIKVSATGGSAEHARQIGDWIRNNYDPSRPFIAIGYSQGAADLLEAYANEPGVAPAMAALITIAGAVGGSRLADGLPPNVTSQLKDLKIDLPTCRLQSLDGVDSLRRKVRHDFLTAPTTKLPRSYSIAAKSTYGTTSRVLQGGWKQLSAYSIDQDSQVIRDDSMVPGGRFLGTARGDHWSVALPFIEANDPELNRLVDRNTFPRTELLESAVRFVMKDLKENP
jgi:hypothetical protein